jgi:hypothetical protein
MAKAFPLHQLHLLLANRDMPEIFNHHGRHRVFPFISPEKTPDKIPL